MTEPHWSAMNCDVPACKCYQWSSTQTQQTGTLVPQRDNILRTIRQIASCNTHKEKYSQTMIMKQISKLLRSQLQIKVLTFKWQGDLSWRQISFCHPIISAKNYCTWKYAMETWPTFFNIKESVYWQLMRPACVNNLLPASVNTKVHWIRNYDYTLRVIIEPTILTYQQ